ATRLTTRRMSRPGRIVAIVAVEAEAKALADVADAEIVVAGIGRTNAAAATTRAILEDAPIAAVVSIGIAGALPDSGLGLGELAVASESVYVEEGLETPEGFGDMRALGFPLGDFEGNRVPANDSLLAMCSALGRVGPIATVATCSVTDRLAREVVRRTGAIAEAMEGAAVLHAARRLGVAAIEIRAISNTTGDRPTQRWEIAKALGALGGAWPRLVEAIRSSR
ncbi:MAG: futalosine hydrolase, partial [Phycisphaerales bacterium]